MDSTVKVNTAVINIHIAAFSRLDNILKKIWTKDTNKHSVLKK